jgi:hypothetical protein
LQRQSDSGCLRFNGKAERFIQTVMHEHAYAPSTSHRSGPGPCPAGWTPTTCTSPCRRRGTTAYHQAHHEQVHRGSERGEVLLDRALTRCRAARRCRYSVATTCSVMKWSRAARRWRLLMAARPPRTPAHCCLARRSGDRPGGAVRRLLRRRSCPGPGRALGRSYGDAAGFRNRARVRRPDRSLSAAP